MKNVYKLTILMVFLFVFSGFSIAQDTLNVASLSKDNSSSTWHLLKQQSAVKIYYQYVDCGPIEFVNFKVENTSNQSVTVAWNFEFLSNGTAIATNPDAANFNMTIGANSSEFGACSGVGNFPLHIYLREAYQAFRLDSILIKNLSITI